MCNVVEHQFSISRESLSFYYAFKERKKSFHAIMADAGNDQITRCTRVLIISCVRRNSHRLPGWSFWVKTCQKWTKPCRSFLFLAFTQMATEYKQIRRIKIYDCHKFISWPWKQVTLVDFNSLKHLQKHFPLRLAYSQICSCQYFFFSWKTFSVWGNSFEWFYFVFHSKFFCDAQKSSPTVMRKNTFCTN